MLVSTVMGATVITSSSFDCSVDFGSSRTCGTAFLAGKPLSEAGLPQVRYSFSSCRVLHGIDIFVSFSKSPSISDRTSNVHKPIRM